MWMCLFLGALLFQQSQCYKTLTLLSTTKLPTSMRNGLPLYSGINLGTATAAAYDFSNNIVYVIGETSHFMHVIDVIDPSNPVYLFTHEFTRGEGVPQSIDVCGPELAVGLSAQTDVHEGHVRFYHVFARGSGDTDITLDGYVTVGSSPSHIRYTSDCGTVVVANEGKAGKDEAGTYVNPQGTITIIHGERTGNPSVRLVDFFNYNIGELSYNQNLRAPSLYIPSSTLARQTTVAEDIEPEHVAISDDGNTAWVTLQENSAIAKISLSRGVVDEVSLLPNKDWADLHVDASDRDGGVHRRVFPGLQSLRQPGVMASLEIGGKTFLFTGDEGAIKSYSNSLHGFTWTDRSTGKTLAAQVEPEDLKANASNDEYLGRLYVSNIDGKSQFSGKFQHLEMFGGRGFSIWDSANMAAPVFDSEDTLEMYMEDYNKAVFNTDYVASTATYQSPEMTRDVSSYQMGGAVTGIDVADDNGTVYLVVGTKSTGTLFLYTVDTASGQPIPQFLSIVRSGVTDLPWKDLYADDTLGDLYISDLGIITSDQSPIDKPLVYVTSAGAGTLSLYEIVDKSAVIPGPGGV